MKSKTQKKKMTAVSSIMLALIMILTMLPISRVFADDTAIDRTFEIFQIFTGSVDESDTMGNITWGYSAASGYTGKVDSDLLNTLKEDGDSLTEAALAVELSDYVDFSKPISGWTATAMSTAGEYKISGLETGYYLVRDLAGSKDGESEYYTLYCLRINSGEVVVKIKGDIPTISKKVNYQDSTDASIGETVHYTISTTLPSTITNYNTYYLKFADTLSEGLTYKAGTMKVFLGDETGTDVTKYFYRGYVDAAHETAITVAIEDVLALNNVDGCTVTSGTTITVAYDAVLNEDAVIAPEKNPNEVNLIYSNDPNHSGVGITDTPDEYTEEDPDGDDEPTTSNPTGYTVTVVVNTLTTELVITKQEGQNYQSLTGVEFTLEGDGVKIVLVSGKGYQEDADGTYYKLADGTYTETAPNGTNDELYANTETKYILTDVEEVKQVANEENQVVGEVNSDGHLTFTGLGAGTYTLTETKTPAGYNTVDPITFTISYDVAKEEFTCTTPGFAVNNGSITTTIVNYKGTILPTTGGMGTTIFYVLGSILVLGAAVVLVTRKRMSLEED